jgi:N-acyl-phosphatidylethanolamine-hydrolysing phospholipase D
MEAMMKPPADKIQITWIGHSTFLVQVDGLNFLTDPVWSDRCSPVTFAGPKRYRHVPFDIKDLPKIDFVLISHNHYDHLDGPSVEKLHKLQQPHAPVWIVPLGVASWFRKTLKGALNVVELGWWDCFPLNESLDVVGTPAQHWSKRTATDDFCSLWGGFAVTSKRSGKNIFFAGDTGYCSAFKEIRRKFGSFDLALIPIGAYLPRDLMRNQHVDPREAVQIHKDINSKQSVGMHWGTFVLTDEQLLDPKTDLADVLAEEKLEPNEFTTLYHGETKTF